jgi:hypothetical protein
MAIVLDSYVLVTWLYRKREEDLADLAAKGALPGGVSLSVFTRNPMLVFLRKYHSVLLGRGMGATSMDEEVDIFSTPFECIFIIFSTPFECSCFHSLVLRRSSPSSFVYYRALS